MVAGTSAWRIGMAMGAASAFALLLVLLWPSARSAGEVLLSQDDPSQLSDVRLGSVLRNDPALLERNIVAALDAGDSDLARGFLDLAIDKGIAIPPALAGRVAAATADERAPSHVAKKFITGFVTGDVTDGATLSGTVASRFERRAAEDIAEGAAGVIHVQNNLRVRVSTGPGW